MEEAAYCQALMYVKSGQFETGHVRKMAPLQS